MAVLHMVEIGERQVWGEGKDQQICFDNVCFNPLNFIGYVLTHASCTIAVARFGLFLEVSSPGKTSPPP